MSLTKEQRFENAASNFVSASADPQLGFIHVEAIMDIIYDRNLVQDGEVDAFLEYLSVYIREHAKTNEGSEENVEI